MLTYKNKSYKKRYEENNINTIRIKKVFLVKTKIKKWFANIKNFLIF